MTRSVRLLATARDAGAARHIVEIVRAADAARDIDVRFIAADAAARALRQCGEDFELFSVSARYGPDMSTAEAQSVMSALAAEFDAFEPDLVLAGLASFRGGIDDAALTLANGRRIPSVLLMDDAGHPHDVAQLRPDCVLAVTAEIANWVRQIHRVPVATIGLPRHHALSTAPVERMRAQGRTGLGIPEGVPLVTFFAQTDHLPGHDTNFQALLAALQHGFAAGAPFRCLVRAHPGFPETGAGCHRHALAAGFESQLDAESDPAVILAASDIVLSCVSSSIADYVWLARGSPALNAHLAYLLIGEPIQAHLTGEFGDWRPPLARTGIARLITSETDLDDFIADGLAGRLAPVAYPRGTPAGPSPMDRALEVLRNMANGRKPAAVAAS